MVLEELVASSISERGTPRFTLSPDRCRIRANWGHSLQIDGAEAVEANPKGFLDIREETQHADEPDGQINGKSPWGSPVVLAAVIAAAGTLIVGYWQFVDKPKNPPVVHLRLLVKDANSHLPLSNSHVEIIDGAQRQEDNTDREGFTRAFSIPSSGQPTFQVSVDATEFEPTTENIDRPTSDGTQTVELRRSQPSEPPGNGEPAVKSKPGPPDTETSLAPSTQSSSDSAHSARKVTGEKASGISRTPATPHLTTEVYPSWERVLRDLKSSHGRENIVGTREVGGPEFAPKPNDAATRNSTGWRREPIETDGSYCRQLAEVTVENSAGNQSCHLEAALYVRVGGGWNFERAITGEEGCTQ